MEGFSLVHAIEENENVKAGDPCDCAVDSGGVAEDTDDLHSLYSGLMSGTPKLNRVPVRHCRCIHAARRSGLRVSLRVLGRSAILRLWRMSETVAL